MKTATGKKLLLILTAALLALSLLLSGCGGDGGKSTETKEGSETRAPETHASETEEEECRHQYVAKRVVDPTCTAEGYTLYECASCGDTMKGDITDALGHSFTFDEANYVAPTASAPGYVTYTCAECGATAQSPEITYDSRNVEYTTDSTTKTATVKRLRESVAASLTNLTIFPYYVSGNTKYRVVGIEDGAFLDNTVLTTVWIPDTVVSIGNEAFSGCTALTTVNFGVASELETIGDKAFYGCVKVRSFALPKSLETIGEEAFSGCSIAAVTNSMYGKLKTIGDRAFFESGVSIFRFPSTVESIGSYAFGKCASLSEVRFSATGVLETIPNYAFTGCHALKKLTVPAYVREIGKNAFYECRNLAELRFAEGSVLESIGDNAFYDSAFTELTLPATVRTLGTGAFYYPRGLETLSLPTSLTEISDKCFYYATSLTEVRFVGEGESALTRIGTGAFYHAVLLPGIAIPAQVAVIGNEAFSGCTSLARVDVAEGSVLESVGNSAFSGCAKLASFAFPATVGSIGNYAFFEAGLGELTFAASETPLSIGYFAFYGNRALQSVTFPAGLFSLGESAFGNCSGLTSVLFTTGEGELTIGRTAFGLCTSLARVDLPDNLKAYNEYAFLRCSDDVVLNFNGDLESHKVPDTGSEVPVVTPEENETEPAPAE